MFKGNNFVEKAKTFSHDPLDAEKRSEMIKSSRQLVREVTKLLILGEFRPWLHGTRPVPGRLVPFHGPLVRTEKNHGTLNILMFNIIV